MRIQPGARPGGLRRWRRQRRLGRRHPGSRADSRAQPDAYAYADSDSHSCAGTHPHAYADSDANPGSGADAYAEPDSCTGAHSHADANSHAEPDSSANSCTISDACSVANPQSDSDSDAYPHAYANPDSGTDTHSYACTDAYSVPDAGPHADAHPCEHQSCAARLQSDVRRSRRAGSGHGQYRGWNSLRLRIRRQWFWRGRVAGLGCDHRRLHSHC